MKSASVWGLSIVFSLGITASVEAADPMLIAKTPAGRDIIAHCRTAIETDNRNAMAGGRTGVADPGLQSQYFIGWVFSNWDYLKAPEIQKAIPGFEQNVRDGGWVNGLVCALRRRLQQLQNPGLIGTAPPPNIAAKPPPPAPKPMASQQTMRDYAEEKIMMQEIAQYKARYTQIRPCAWRATGIQDPCVKNNLQSEYQIAMALRASLEARRSRVSKEFYASVTQSWQRARDNALTGCTKLDTSTTPCTLPGQNFGKRTPATSAPVSTMANHWDSGVREPPKPPPAPAKKAAGRDRSKDKPEPHLSDDQKVLNEILRLQRADYDDFRRKRLAHIKAEADRHDALTVVAEEMNGGPAFRVINNTDIMLIFTISYSLTIDGEPQSVLPYSFVIGAFGNNVFPLVQRGKWQITNVYTKWWAHPSNFEGTWNTGLQGQ